MCNDTRPWARQDSRPQGPLPLECLGSNFLASCLSKHLRPVCPGRPVCGLFDDEVSSVTHVTAGASCGPWRWDRPSPRSASAGGGDTPLSRPHRPGQPCRTPEGYNEQVEVREARVLTPRRGGQRSGALSPPHHAFLRRNSGRSGPPLVQHSQLGGAAGPRGFGPCFSSLAPRRSSGRVAPAARVPLGAVHQTHTRHPFLRNSSHTLP